MTKTHGPHQFAARLVIPILTLIAVFAAPPAQAQTFTTVFNFANSNGSLPNGLIQATDGRLYGTTNEGGTRGGCQYGCGTVFKITPNGSLTSLHILNVTEGYYPFAGPIQATDGNFYGTTRFGGAHRQGIVYKITSSGTLATLYSFCAQNGCTDGEEPIAALVQATDGNLYGTAEYGGDQGYGTVFKITPSGALTRIYSFCPNGGGCSDGSYPYGLIQASDGYFYGTTIGGGTTGYGTVFKLTRTGTLTTLYSFCQLSACQDGDTPYAPLVEGADGNLYGTTQFDGANGQGGTVFKITPNGLLTTLYSFCSQGGCADGDHPEGGALVQGTDGNFYGTTASGGAKGLGTVFRMTPGGALTTLHSFDGADGYSPEAGLVQDTNGTFYGTTAAGGANGYGTVFALSVGLGPFVEAQPASAKVGAPVKILGTNLSGATSVKFNGTPAVFQVSSPSFITTTVPSGATTGFVTVTLPGGTLKSNVKFRVRL